MILIEKCVHSFPDAGSTARSFGGLTMTFNLDGHLQTHPVAVILCLHTQLKVFVILRPTKVLDVFDWHTSTTPRLMNDHDCL